VYAVMPDPLVEAVPPAGSDPQGNAEAESTLDVVVHEVAEGVTDPTGTGWMDPNGFEVGDRCELGPQEGTPLGYGPNGSPYNELINGHGYLLQTMWSDRNTGCRQSANTGAQPAALPLVSLTQYSATIAGRTGVSRRLPVQAALARAGSVVGQAVGSTDANGYWRLTLRAANGSATAVGDDRDELLVRYGRGGPRPELIQTGDGGNPFTAAGWTGWFDLDHGFAAGRNSVLLSPCSQVGDLTLRIDGSPAGSLLLNCSGANNSVRIHTRRLGPATRLTLSSQDNRATTSVAPYGGLIRLTAGLGEPGAVASDGSSMTPFQPGGIAGCSADLRRQSVTCDGLVPGARYTLVRRRAGARVRGRADSGGSVSFPHFRGHRAGVAGGDQLTLRSAVGRSLTVLHVAHLRVDLAAGSPVVTAGRCQPNLYVGPPLSMPPLGLAVGLPGVAGAGSVCPPNGSAAGLDGTQLQQQDDLSRGFTQTEVPDITGTIPVANATLYGSFVLLAQASLPGSQLGTSAVGDPVSVRIARRGGGHVLVRIANANTPGGVQVGGLPPGVYTATWALRDAAGDTRTLHTQFVEQSG
jgi:hypothetical protein